MIRLSGKCTVFFLMLWMTLHSHAIHSENHIVAIVNDEIISQYDVEKRLNFLIRKLELSQKSDVRQVLLPQIVQMLINEHLKIQKALSLHLDVGTSNILRVINGLVETQDIPSLPSKERSLSTPNSSLFFTDDSSIMNVPVDYTLNERRIKSNGHETDSLKDTTFINSICSEIALHKIIQHTVKPPIGESDIETLLQTQYNNIHQTKNLLAEIVLLVDTPAHEEVVLVLAEQLVGQIRTGTDFKAIARHFSQTASASHGGDIGWITQGQMEHSIEKVISKMKPGQVSMPIKTLSGYTIILLREKKSKLDNFTFTLRQLFMPLTGPEALSPQNQSELLKVARRTSSCEDFDLLIQQTGNPQSGPIGEIRADDLLPTPRAAVLQLAPYTASVPVPMNGGIAILMVCDKTNTEEYPGLSSRKAITQQLERAKIESIRHQVLRTLRRAAFIEVRSQ